MSLLFGNRQTSAGARQRQKLPWYRRLLMVPVHHLQQAVGSLGELWRNPFASLMTMAVLGLSLTLPSALYVLVKNTSAVSGEWQQASQMSLFLRKDIDSKTIETLRTQLSLKKEIETVSLITREQGLEEFREQSGFGETLDYLESNPLPDVLLVIPAEEFRSPAKAEALLKELEQAREVDFGKLDLQWLQRLQALLDLAKDIMGGLAILLCLSVVLIVGNTIRLNILSQREEIVVMKLVGATNAFIQRPFLYTGVWYGFVGGILAWFATAILIWWVEGSVLQVSELYQTQFQLTGLNLNEMLMIWLIAILLGLAGSYLAVRRHIRSIEPR
ncbi:permease-like cell division protein FtsX [Idiomarina seosinensis]|uniref:permease-like cell division protein FtsX n=1 Tax=Idiomarina seosinensis TaxID=281739 RepID=UPI00384ACF0C